MDQSWEYCLLPRPDIEYGTNLRLYSVLGTVDAVRSAAMCELGEDGWEYVGQLAKNGEYSDDLLFRRALPSTVPEAERPDVLVIADSPAYDPDSLIRHDDPVIFIGHGHSSAWRDVKDHLVEQHGYLVEAYETGARAGHTVRDILAGALDRAAFAIVLLTKEDETAEGAIRPRQNAVHELGLFQGRLGSNRAIAVVEEGLDVLSNLEGVHQIRYVHSVRETFGDILATIAREFGPPPA
jgi:hypothetical protein